METINRILRVVGAFGIGLMTSALLISIYYY